MHGISWEAIGLMAGSGFITTGRITSISHPWPTSQEESHRCAKAFNLRVVTKERRTRLHVSNELAEITNQAGSLLHFASREMARHAIGTIPDHAYRLQT